MTNREKETERNNILEELYRTGRYKNLYMGIESKSKENPLKAYIKGWLINKGITHDMEETVDDFYAEAFLHICKIPTDTLIEIAENPKKLTATCCLIIKRQLFSNSEKPSYSLAKRILKDEHNIVNLNEQYWKNYNFFELPIFSTMNKKKLEAELEGIENKKDQLLYLLSYTYYYKNNMKSKATSYFERVFEDMPSDIDAYDVEYKVRDDWESSFKKDYGFSVEHILDNMTPEEYEEFHKLAHSKKQQKKLEKLRYEEALDKMAVVVNRIKFNSKEYE